jgi:hypothetical protein
MGASFSDRTRSRLSWALPSSASRLDRGYVLAGNTGWSDRRHVFLRRGAHHVLRMRIADCGSADIWMKSEIHRDTCVDFEKHKKEIVSCSAVEAAEHGPSKVCCSMSKKVNLFLVPRPYLMFSL